VKAKLLAFLLLVIILIIPQFGCKTAREDTKAPNRIIVYKSDTLLIEKVSKYTYQHTSFLNTDIFKNIPCNGMIIIHKNEAIVFDTPVDNESSSELIDWIKETMNSEIIAVVITHSHIDSLGGLDEFHRRGISSFAHNLTIQIAKETSFPVPQFGFEEYMELKVGNEKVHIRYFGEGHTIDNIIGYFPLENVMFGGCLIKAWGAGKGNLAEANVYEWPETVRRIKSKYPNVEKIIIGHGNWGGAELLDYTIKLFEQ